MRIVRVDRTSDTYVARDADGVVWTVELHLDMRGTPFREEIVWPAASVVAVGGGDAVHFLSAESGAVVATLPLEVDTFGHFGPADGDVLYVLGWRHVVAVDRTLATRWVSRDLAVDGLVWKDQVGDRILLSAEMDPPGGWVDVEIDVLSGSRIARTQGRPG